MATVGEKMTAIANAIRKKTGGTAKLTLDTMASSLNNIPERTSSNLTASGATVTVPAGNYKTQATKSVATVGRANTTISVSADDTNDKLTITASNNQGTGYVTGANKTATKTITLTASGSSVTASDGTNKVSKSVATATQATPSVSINSSGLITASATQTAGYVAAGTKSGTKQLTTQAAKTVTPSTSAQTAVASGVYTTGAVTVAAMPTATQATPSISVNSSGLITASATQTAGYVAAGTKSATKQLTTKAATTITPSTSNQTVAAGTYLTGALTVAGDADLVAANIVSGKNIFNVAGTHTCTSNVLNFTVVGGTTQPSSPAANTIWVNTSTTITSWVCDRAEPTGSNGMVWIKVGNADNSFNALKTNTITIYPICCYQYVSGTWEKKDSKQYINGAWETWWSGEIYSYGNKYEDVTGGFQFNTAGKAYVTYNTDNIYLHCLGSTRIVGGLFTNNKIDISGFSSLKMDFNFPKETEYSQCFALCIDNENTEYYGYGDRVAWAGVPAYESGDFTVTLDVSNFSGSYYIGVQWNACSGTVYRIWLE